MKREINTSNVDDMVPAITDLVNNFGFDSEKFNKMMSNEHRTLQQSFTRLCLKWLEHVSNEEYRTDLRNESSKEISKEIVESFKAKKGYKPSEYLRYI
jgi:hypothetical protein